MSSLVIFASSNACLIGVPHFLTIGSTNSSSFALLKSLIKLWGFPSAPMLMKGRLTWLVRVVDNSIFAFSAASLNLWTAWSSSMRSMPSVFLNSSARYLRIALSISVPPNWVSPLVDCTSNTPSPNSMMVTSKVPPPKSNTRMLMSSSDCLSIPYARLAAVGSFTSLTTSRPAIVPASLVAVLWLSSK